MAHEHTPTSCPCRWMPVNEFLDFTSSEDEVDLNASPNMVHFCELLDQPFGASSNMIGGDYSYDFPPPPPPTPPPLTHFHEELATHMDDSHRPTKEEEAPVATADLSPSIRPQRKKPRSEVWQFFDHAYT